MSVGRLSCPARRPEGPGKKVGRTTLRLRRSRRSRPSARSAHQETADGACFDSRSDDRAGEPASSQARRNVRRRSSGQSSVRIGVPGQRAERCPIRLLTRGSTGEAPPRAAKHPPGARAPKQDRSTTPPLCRLWSMALRRRSGFPDPNAGRGAPAPLQPVWRLRASGAPITAGTYASHAQPWVRPAREAGSGGPAR